MDIFINNHASIPIYEQISSQIKAMIINGDLKAGEALPSIRGLAKSLHISVLRFKNLMMYFKRTVLLKQPQEKVALYPFKIKISIWKNSKRK